MSSTARFASILLLLGTTCPLTTRAFSDAEMFHNSAAIGGGGGRYFTGSPLDAFGCSACHEHGSPPSVRVSGLPIGGYQPGANYEVTIDWSDELTRVAGAFEITGMDGRRAGELRLPTERELLDPEACEDESPAGELLAVPQLAETDSTEDCTETATQIPTHCREVVHVRDCGAQRARMLWTAPGLDFGRLWFAGSLVSADGDETSDGDGVADIGHLIASPTAAGEVTVNAGCSVSTPAPNQRGAALWLVFLCGLCVRKRFAWWRWR